MQRRLDPETGVNNLLKMFHVRGVFRIFFRKGAPIFVTFSSVLFPVDSILSNLSSKNDSRGSGSMLPRKNFENLHTAMVNVF